METIEIQIGGKTIKVPLTVEDLEEVLDQLNEAVTAVEEEGAFLGRYSARY